MQCVLTNGNPELRVMGGCTASDDKEAAKCCAQAAKKVLPQEALSAYKAVLENPPLLEGTAIGLLAGIHALEQKHGIDILG